MRFRSDEASSAISSSLTIQRFISFFKELTGIRPLNSSVSSSPVSVAVSSPYFTRSSTHCKRRATFSNSSMESGLPMEASFKSWRASKLAPKERRSLLSILLKAAAVCAWAFSIHSRLWEGRSVAHIFLAGALPQYPSRIAVILSNSRVCKTFPFITY